jgi:hypothetical protein
VVVPPVVVVALAVFPAPLVTPPVVDAAFAPVTVFAGVPPEVTGPAGVPPVVEPPPVTALVVEPLSTVEPATPLDAGALVPPPQPTANTKAKAEALRQAATFSAG